MTLCLRCSRMMTIALSLFYKHFTHVIVTRFNLNQLHSSAALNIPIAFIAYDVLRLHAYSPSICWKGAATLTQSTNRISLSQSGRCASELCSLRATRHKSWAANRWIKLQRCFDKEQENKQKQTHVILRLRTARLRSSIHSVERK